MKYEIIQITGSGPSEIELPEEIFSVPIRKDILWLVVRWQLAKKRRGTHSTKTRGEVSGGGRKPWAQKHTGRARQGSIRAPHWRHGGIVFGPKPRSYAFKVNKKVRKLALRIALSHKVSGKLLKIVDAFPELNKPSAKEGRNLLNKIGVYGEKSLIILPDGKMNIRKSLDNFPYVKVLKKEGLNVYDILRFKYLVLPVTALEYITEVYKP